MDVLIVDDDKSVCDALQAHFQQQGYQVRCAFDGATALDLLRQNPVDVLLCDLHMPRLNGVQLVEKLLELHKSFPVIMMSTQASREELASFLRLPIYDFFEKPISDIEALERTVKKAVKDHQLNNDQQQLQFLNKKLEKSLSHLQVDLQAGRYVQRKMLPDSPKQFGEYQFSHKLLPSSYLSGDFVEYVLVGTRYVCFFIADVSGHGASSAFITVLLKNITARLRSAWIHADDQCIISPANFLARINREFIALESGKHATLFAGVLDMQKHSLRYSMAGHHPLPLLKTAEETTYLEAKGRPIGLFPEYSVQEHEIDLPEVFSLVLFSDGILEILEQSNIQEKEQVLLETVKQQSEVSIDQLSKAIGVDDKEEFPDDVAMFILRRQPAE